MLPSHTNNCFKLTQMFLKLLDQRSHLYSFWPSAKNYQYFFYKLIHLILLPMMIYILFQISNQVPYNSPLPTHSKILENKPKLFRFIFNNIHHKSDMFGKKFRSRIIKYISPSPTTRSVIPIGYQCWNYIPPFFFFTNE